MDQLGNLIEPLLASNPLPNTLLNTKPLLPLVPNPLYSHLKMLCSLLPLFPPSICLILEMARSQIVTQSEAKRMSIQEKGVQRS